MSKIEEVLTRGVEQVFPSKGGLAALMKKGKITLYQGFDPSSSSLHIGNLIGIRKLAQFQKLGHKVIFLIGDFTGMVGDPTDKSAARQKMTRKQVLENAKSYKDQISRVLEFEGTNPADIKYNSQWLSKLNFEELLEITSNFTAQQMIERDMYQRRLEKNKPIYLHEFLYPVMQGYDCVFMDVDLEIGGSDQLFNMMAGRSLMKSLKKKEKYVLTMKLLEDQSGKKMGKTEGNTINLTDLPEDIFGKIMALPDTLLNSGIELLTDISLEELKKDDPMELKKKLASAVVEQVHGKNKVLKAKEYFEQTFQKRKTPTALHTTYVKEKSMTSLNVVSSSEIFDLSKTEIKRLLAQGAIKFDGKVVTNPTKQIDTKKGVTVRVGKAKFDRIKKK